MRYISFNFQLVYIDKCQYGLAGLDILEFLYVDFTYISVEGGYKAGIFQFIDGSVESSFGRSIFRKQPCAIAPQWEVMYGRDILKAG